MQAYSEYKDSGVEWLGEIPKGWKVKRFRNMFFFSKGLTITKENLQETGVPCVNYGEVHSKYGFEIDPKKHVLKCVKNDYLVSNPKSLLSIGDFVFADTSEDIEGSGNFTQLVSNDLVFAGYHTVITKPIGDNNFRYLAYVLDSVSFRNQIRKSVKGVKVFSITKTILKNTSIWLPSNLEQTAIAHFLDNKVGKIERLLAIKQQQIDLLKERQQILIQNAVTQGLNPNVPKKDSGIDWIGEIPVHWKVNKLRYLGTFQNGISAGAEYFGSGFPFVTYGDVYNNPVLPLKPSGLAKSSINDRKVYSIRVGDVFFTRTSEVANDIGIASTCLNTIKNASFSGFVIRMRPTTMLLSPKYSRYLFRCNYISDFFAHEMNIVIRASLAQELLKNLPIFLPPMEEQEIIAESLKAQSKKINTAIQIKQQQIEKLNEYKTTLINAAVTGKIKVPLVKQVA